ncbi:hypothetical protein IQ251_09170 [Saccharopolyspora sp. HNM0983]|uniref:Uncharacterized protein n=1 Tax=Saccharopolyspora montiporae TaxID=2781240 RepID=A0A929G0A6_9PSEU|nr:hypothetical protein [Saccharopolyspora sp. HNM0983]MBE9374617.1 hypothetical protein [Saccharopolyspora sp. HNM0983]
MPTHRHQLVRLCRVALDRPGWQQLLACAVSVWALAWMAGQLPDRPGEPGALTVLGELAARAGLAGTGWADRIALAWADSGAGPAVFSGLLWAATTERGQLPALLGWVGVMLSSEQLGYRPAVLIALGSMLAFITVLWLAALTGSGFVDRAPALLPRDVLRAGATAAALSAVVPLFAPLLFVTRVARPYVTVGPRRLDPAEPREQFREDSPPPDR